MCYIRYQQPGGIDFVIRDREGSVIGLGAGITGKVVPAFLVVLTFRDKKTTGFAGMYKEKL